MFPALLRAWRRSQDDVMAFKCRNEKSRAISSSVLSLISVLSARSIKLADWVAINYCVSDPCGLFES